ncbi:hypothetical protein [Streptomyces sp. NPDC094437]|uniref:Rv1733c family protein n=1 Tax=Streptomyces sp. NPDC094437 TaxID=3366060 RepID=UPI0037F4B531
MAFRGPKVRLWRWRRNPLRRRSDAVEAWVVLGAWLFTVLAGVVAGLTAARTVEHGLARERVEWGRVQGHLIEEARGAPDQRTGPSGDLVWGKVSWSAPDGTERTGQVRVVEGSPADTPVEVWTDRRGRLVSEPATASEARLRASLIGCLVGLSAAAVPLVGGRLLCGRLERRRLDQWDTAWARFDPRGDRRKG